MAVVISTAGTTATPKLIRRKDGAVSAPVSGSTLTIASGQVVRCVIGDDDTPDEENQKLTAYVNGTQRLQTDQIGTEYIDEPVCRDRNTDTTYGGSAGSDCLDLGGSARYFYQQDANHRVAAPTDEAAAGQK